jgi:L-ascorbate metabolism protein UlaG (beta-lactamase superfamily)
VSAKSGPGAADLVIPVDAQRLIQFAEVVFLHELEGARMRITLIGGPTVLLEIDGVRLLTDPTFDPAGGEYVKGPITLRKTIGPAVSPTDVRPIDAVLLSHDQHYDNLDHWGRDFLPNAGQVITTQAGAERLGGNAVGLAPWESAYITSADGAATLHVTATPARHGPPGIEPVSGNVIGFVVRSANESEGVVYVTGDTVWYEGVAEVARHFGVKAIVLFAGAAQLKERGPARLTMNHEDAIATALTFPEAVIIPAHTEGWEHFSESRETLADAFAADGLGSRLCLLDPGVAKEVPLGAP